MTKKRRIAVTGLGVVSCLGNEVESFYQQLLAGKSGVRTIQNFDCSELPTQIAGEIDPFDLGDYLEKKQARRVDSFIAYTIVAGKKALESTGTDFSTIPPERRGVVIGSGMGGMGVFVDGVETMLHKNWRKVTPFFIPYILTNMAGGLLAKDLEFMGPNYSISTACATGTHSIVAAANHIRQGDADVMLCGGVEAAVLPMGVAGFCAIKALSRRNDAPQEASRPWDRGRDGFVMGEGAGIIVLEEMEHALARGAKIYAEYLGGAFSCDAWHMTEPRPGGDGIAYCITQALKDAETTPDQIDYINAHATSTPAGDMVEIEALKKAFPNWEGKVLNSTKSLLGHALGAAGGLEAVVAAMALETQEVHPTLNLTDPEPGLAGFDVPVVAKKCRLRRVLSNSYGFGGHNAVVVFGAI